MANLVGDLEHFSGRRVLITGHTGFKGSWLAQMLVDSGAVVTGVSLAPETQPSHFSLLGLEHNVDSRICDIRDLISLRSIFDSCRPEFVFHLAAQAFVRRSYSDPYTTFSTNVIGSANVLECVRASASVAALVYITSDKCYKNKEQRTGYVETDELGGVDPYSASKASAELVFSSYFESQFNAESAPRIASARAGNVVGGGDWSIDRLIPDCIRALEDSRPITLRYPNATRPWQHVLEPLSGYLRLAVRLEAGAVPSGSSWNFGPPEDSIHEVQEVAEIIAAEWGRPGSVETTKRTDGPHESQLLHLNSDKAMRELCWSTKWGFAETIRRTVRWFLAVKAGKLVLPTTRDDVREYLEG